MAGTYIDKNGVERVQGTNMRVSGASNNREAGYESKSYDNKAVQPSASYKQGGTYGGRETAYTWKDGTTTYSNLTRWEDAAKEAGKEGVGLASAVSYRVNNGKPVSDRAYSSSYSYDQNGYDAAKRYREQLAGVWGVDPGTGEYTGNYAGPEQGYYGEQQRFTLDGADPAGAAAAETALRQQYISQELGLAGGVPGGTGSGSNPYAAMIAQAEAEGAGRLDQIRDLYGGNEDLINAYIDALYQGQEGMYARQKDQAAEAAEDALRQQYISREQSLAGLGELLGAQGINGGGVESSYANILSGYQQGRGDILAQQNQALADIDAALAQAYAEAEAQRYQQLLANEQQQASALMAAEAENRSYLDALKQNAINYDLTQQQLALEQQQYQDALLRQELSDTLSLAEAGLLTGDTLYERLQGYGVSPELAAAYVGEVAPVAAGSGYSGGSSYSSGYISGGSSRSSGSGENSGSSGLSEDKVRKLDNLYLGYQTLEAMPFTHMNGLGRQAVAQEISRMLASGELTEDEYEQYYQLRS